MEKESRTIVFASHNAHKTEEMRRICGERFRIVSLADLGCDTDIPENGLTLEENAEAKARWVYERYGMECFADDTGLEVDALGGAPGVHTARFAGPECDARHSRLRSQGIDTPLVADIHFNPAAAFEAAKQIGRAHV